MPFVKVAGEKVYYVEKGRHGAPVIFVHGSGGSHLVWWSQVRALAATARALALDLPGHGKSPPGRSPVTIETYRDVVVGLLDALKLDRAVIVGHSMGGAIAQSTALAYPGRVAGLGLVGTGARLRVLPAILEGLIGDYDQTARLVLENSFAPGADLELLKRADERFRACPPAVTHADFAACDAFDVMSRLAEIQAPTLVLCGRQDRMTPVKYSEFLTSRIAGARLHVIEAAGHSVMLEKPDEVSQAFVEFVGSLGT